jgi:metallo-beta-lactamase family protein
MTKGGFPHRGEIMKLKVLGAAGEVTGSNYLVEVGSSKVLIDCGLHQGRGDDKKNREPFQFDPSAVTSVILTHAHIDHSGRIPVLFRQGFAGKVFATLPTVQLTEVLWKDSVHLMKEEAEWRTRKNARKGLPPVEPLYNEEDYEKAKAFLEPTSYDDVVDVAPGIKVRFRDAGHILGSAILELFLDDGSEKVKLVFSGDLGPQNPVMGRNPAFIEDADYVVIESTYGDRLHKDNEETRAEFRKVMGEALKSRSKVLIPTFVVDRAQRLMYELMLMQKDGLLRDNVPIYFDSPMGVTATEIYKNYPGLFSSEVQDNIYEGHDPFAPRQMNYVSKVDESRAVNQVKHAVVMAGSGMCNGGRIIHHLKHGIWNEKNHILFVGYQAVGTLGRRLVEGEKTVRIAGEEVTVKAQMHTINGFSAHADKDDLMTWASNFRTDPVFFVTHGEEKSSSAFTRSLNDRGMKAVAPHVNQEFELTASKEKISREELVSLCKTPQPSEVQLLLTDIAELAESLKCKAEDVENMDEIRSLLDSTRLLLETANSKTGAGSAD